MAMYSYFAHIIMLCCLFLVIKYTFEFYGLRRRFLKDSARFKAMLKACDLAKITATRHLVVTYHKRLMNKEVQQTLEEQTLHVFSPLLLKVNAIKSIAPALGLCFTVISIILSFQVFSSSGDIKTMFQAAAVGLGTTAMGALVMSLAKWLTDRKLVPAYQHAFLLNQAHFRAITKATLKHALNKEKV